MVLRRAFLVVVLVLSLAVVVGDPTAARHPPEPVCAVCTDHLGASAGEHGVEVAAGESHLSIRLFENGSSRWTARVELTEPGEPTTTRDSRAEISGAAAIDALRTNDSLRHAILSGVHRWRGFEDREDLTSSVTNGTLVVRSWKRIPAGGSGPIVFSEFQVDDPSRDASLYAGAGRIVLSAPAGYRVVDGPSGEMASENGTAAIWAVPDGTSASADDWQGPLVDYTTVTFAQVASPVADTPTADTPRGDRSTTDFSANVAVNGSGEGFVGGLDWSVLLLGAVAVFLVGLVLAVGFGSGRHMSRK